VSHIGGFLSGLKVKKEKKDLDYPKQGLFSI